MAKSSSLRLAAPFFALGGLGDLNQCYFARLRAKFSRRSRPVSMFAMLVA